jgi:hypothetical protein
MSRRSYPPILSSKPRHGRGIGGRETDSIPISIPRKLDHKNPGCCFKKAGWKECGKTKGGLLIFEKLPMGGKHPMDKGMRPTKIVFLDFDGVVNAFDEPESLRYLSQTCVANLNTLLERSGASIVISSTWRIGHRIVDMIQILVNAGFRFPERVIGITPRGCQGQVRGDEIGLWLKDHPEVKEFVILDDDSDMGPFMDRLVRSDSDIGLTDLDVEKALKILNPGEERE